MSTAETAGKSSLGGIQSRAMKLLAWVVVGVYFVLSAAGMALQYVSQRTYADLGFPFVISASLVVGLWCAMGAVIISHHPRHPIGWVMLLAIIVWGLDSLAFGYVSRAVISSADPLLLVDFALVWLTWSGFPFSLLTFTLLFLLFPTGQPLSPRWGRLTWIATGALVVYLIVIPLSPTSMAPLSFTSPLAVPDSVWIILKPLWWIALMTLSSCVLAAGLSLVSRLRRARGDERQQVKWFVYSAVFFLLSIPFTAYVEGTGATGGLALYAGVGMLIFSFVAIAVATVFAILKYRLYDIDIVINKTLVYGTLTGTLALVYFASVVLMEGILPTESPIAIVLSTLAIAALFSPLRRRIQGAIDKRFYRRKYDAQQTLAAFSAQMRDEVELEQLSEALLGVVDETMQPTHVSLWLKEGE